QFIQAIILLRFTLLCPEFFEGRFQVGIIYRLQEIIEGGIFNCFNSIFIISRSENNFELNSIELLQKAEPIFTWHLYIKKQNIKLGTVFIDYFQRLFDGICRINN